MTSVAVAPRPAASAARDYRAFAAAGMGSRAAVLACSTSAGSRTWTQLAAPLLASQVLAVTWPAPGIFAAATERGLVALELPAPEC